MFVGTVCTSEKETEKSETAARRRKNISTT